MREFTEAQSKPVLTADGKPWCQNCFVCNVQINFLKETPGIEWIRVDKYVRHKKCYPSSAK